MCCLQLQDLAVYDRSRRRRQHAPPKSREQFASGHGVISQETRGFISTGVRTSNLANDILYVPWSFQTNVLVKASRPWLVQRCVIPYNRNPSDPHSCYSSSKGLHTLLLYFQLSFMHLPFILQLFPSVSYLFSFLFLQLSDKLSYITYIQSKSGLILLICGRQCSMRQFQEKIRTDDVS